MFEQLRGAAWDWWRGTSNVELWGTLAWYDIVLRYRRSMLGPLWLTVSTGALLLGMGPLYAGLFGQPLGRFFPHLTLGIVFWGFFTSTLNDGCAVFITGAQYLKQPGFPSVALVWRNLARNVIQLAHTFMLYGPVMYWAGIQPTRNMLLAIPGFLVVLINLHAMTLTFGMLTARFRDVGQIVASALQLLMFLTPVFWFPESLPSRARFILYNPLAQLLDVMRHPLLGGVPAIGTVWFLMVFTAVNLTVAAVVFQAKRRELVYWL